MSPARSSPPVRVPNFTGRVNPVSSPVPQSAAFPWPNSSNSGYVNAPGYTGTLTTWPGGSLTANTTYSFYKFPGGPPDISEANITFYGCWFPSTDVGQSNANLVTGSGITTFSYCTFSPANVSAPRPTGGVNYTDSYQYAILQNPGAGQLTVKFCDMWGFGEAIQISDPSGSSITQPMLLTDNYLHDPSDQGPSGPEQYHVDGFLCNNGGISYLTVNHNSISWVADTNALALQSGDGTTLYDHITITNNYFGGFGYMVSTGNHTHSTNMTFTGNVWADYGYGYNGFIIDDEPGFGPLYDSVAWDIGSPLGNFWGRNRYWAKRGVWLAKGNDGLYWWPDDQNPASSSSIIGHSTDYVNP